MDSSWFKDAHYKTNFNPNLYHSGGHICKIEIRLQKRAGRDGSGMS
jgi:hypothetical protein